jgi:hypothetical protein
METFVRKQKSIVTPWRKKFNLDGPPLSLLVWTVNRDAFGSHPPGCLLFAGLDREARPCLDGSPACAERLSFLAVENPGGHCAVPTPDGGWRALLDPSGRPLFESSDFREAFGDPERVFRDTRPVDADEVIAIPDGCRVAG